MTKLQHPFKYFLTLQCAEKAPKIKLLSLPYSHRKTVKAKDMVALMNGLTGLIDTEEDKFPEGSKVQ